VIYIKKVIDFTKIKSNHKLENFGKIDIEPRPICSIEDSTKLDIEASEVDIEFLTYIIMTGNTSYECIDMILKHFKLNEVILENGMKLYKDKIGEIEIEFEYEGEIDSLGLELFLTISSLNSR
jgi:hypothetical protein